MPLYWSANSVPALASLSKARRTDILRECKRTRAGILWGWVIGLMVWVPCTYGLFALIQLLARSHYFFDVPPICFLLASVTLASMCVSLNNWILLAILMPEIRRRAESAGRICVNCGYDLRATPDQCPECGQRTGSLNVGE